MDQQQMKSFLNVMGLVTETTLIFYRNLTQLGASSEEVSRLTQAFIGALIYGSDAQAKKQDDKKE